MCTVQKLSENSTLKVKTLKQNIMLRELKRRLAQLIIKEAGEQSAKPSLFDRQELDGEFDEEVTGTSGLFNIKVVWLDSKHFIGTVNIITDKPISSGFEKSYVTNNGDFRIETILTDYHAK